VEVPILHPGQLQFPSAAHLDNLATRRPFSYAMNAPATWRINLRPRSSLSVKSSPLPQDASRSWSGLKSRSGSCLCRLLPSPRVVTRWAPRTKTCPKWSYKSLKNRPFPSPVFLRTKTV